MDTQTTIIARRRSIIQSALTASCNTSKPPSKKSVEKGPPKDECEPRYRRKSIKNGSTSCHEKKEKKKSRIPSRNRFLRFLSFKKKKASGADSKSEQRISALESAASFATAKEEKESVDGKNKVKATEKVEAFPETSKDISSPPQSASCPDISEKLPTTSLSPQQHLDAILKERGYSTETFDALQTGYCNKPTPIQQASYNVFLCGLVGRNEVQAFEKIMTSGISLNPCNRFGSSLVHNICRRGHHELLDIIVNNGGCVKVADEFGRTPLHDACWAAQPAFETVNILFDQDPRLFSMRDARGLLPLNYVRKEFFEPWIDFLQTNKDIYWPDNLNGSQQEVPPLTLLEPDTRPMPDPGNALVLDVVKLVASGRISVEEATFLNSCNDDSSNYSSGVFAGPPSDSSSVFAGPSSDELR